MLSSKFVPIFEREDPEPADDDETDDGGLGIVVGTTFVVVDTPWSGLSALDDASPDFWQIS